MSVIQAPAAVCFDWGGTLMSEDGPANLPMADWPVVSAMPGAIECVALLHGLLPLCVATNATASDRAQIERALARVGLERYFAHIFCSAELGCGKDQPEFWRQVAKRLNLPLRRVVMMGDSLWKDVLAPARFGVQTVWFNAEGRQPSLSAHPNRVARLDQFTVMVRDAVNIR